MGLSTYMVCIAGESNPVSHMSRTITSSSLSAGSEARAFNAVNSALDRRWLCSGASSVADPVITTLIFPVVSSSVCHSGRSATIAS